MFMNESFECFLTSEVSMIIASNDILNNKPKYLPNFSCKTRQNERRKKQVRPNVQA